jgi:transcriptional regulator with XRE-family HTH domain
MTILENEVQSQLCSFGARLRELRLQRGWTLQDLAGQSGLSKTFLSRLESGDRQASIAAVLTLSRIFDVSLAFLFESQLATDPCVIVRRTDATEKSSNGLFYIPLSNAGRFFNLQPMRIRVPLSRRGKEHYHHDGEEWLYVLSGGLILSLAGKTYDLESGDAVHFDSRLPHRLIARGTRDAEVLLVASPLSGSVVQSVARQYRAIPAPNLSSFKPRLKLTASARPKKRTN